MAKNSSFQQLFKTPGGNIHRRIGFVICDECHLVEDW